MSDAELGADLHDWESEYAGLEDDLRTEPVEALPCFRRFYLEALSLHPLGETSGQDLTHFFRPDAPDEHGLAPARSTPDHGHVRGGDAQ